MARNGPLQRVVKHHNVGKVANSSMAKLSFPMLGTPVVKEDPIAQYEQARRKLSSTLDAPEFTEEIQKTIGWSPLEDSANTRIASLWSKVVTQKGYYDDPWEANYFISVREKIRQTELFGVLQEMPKGAILHVHPSAMGDYLALVKLAGDFQSKDGLFFFVVDEKYADPSGQNYFKLDDPNHPTPNYHLLSQAVRSPEMLQRIMNDLTVTSVECQNPGGDIWKYFQPIFTRVGPLLSQPPLELAYYTDAFRYMLETDNVIHVELRTSWRHENEIKDGYKESIILKALETVNNGKAVQLSMKAIWSDSRHVTPQSVSSIAQDMKDVVTEMQSPDNHYLVGYDLVGEEDTGSTSHYFINDIFNCLATSATGTLLPRFFFHDGESDLPPNLSLSISEDAIPAEVGFNNNIVDAFLVNKINFQGTPITPGRVGHALTLYKTPQLMDDFKEAKIALELCPVSNQLLRYIVDIRDHPGQLYLSCGLPCSLNPDDPAIYGYQGVTFDFWEACVAWNLNLKAMKILCYYSLEYSALSETEKLQRKAIWTDQWQQFIHRVIDLPQ